MTIMSHKITALIGPNGAGKTTLFNLITGQLHLDTGKIFFQGEDISNLPPHEICKRGMSQTFQIASIFPRLSVLECVRTALLSRQGKTFNFLLRAQGMATNKSMELLETVGLVPQAHKVSGALALGDQKLLEIALALAMEPTLLLLDEPTAGMAAHERSALVDFLARIVATKQLTVLFIEHDMDMVFSIADKISVAHQGVIIAEDEPSAIRANEKVQGIYLGCQKQFFR